MKDSVDFRALQSTSLGILCTLDLFKLAREQVVFSHQQRPFTFAETVLMFVVLGFFAVVVATVFADLALVMVDVGSEKANPPFFPFLLFSHFRAFAGSDLLFGPSDIAKARKWENDCLEVEKGSMSFLANIEKETERNKDFRRVLHTTPTQQLVLMNIPFGEEIGLEKHATVTQFFRVEEGKGLLVLGDDVFVLGPGDAIVVGPNTWHNVLSKAKKGLKLYTIYSPPVHAEGLTQKAKPRKESDEFDI